MLLVASKPLLPWYVNRTSSCPWAVRVFNPPLVPIVSQITYRHIRTNMDNREIDTRHQWRWATFCSIWIILTNNELWKNRPVDIKAQSESFRIIKRIKKQTNTWLSGATTRTGILLVSLRMRSVFPLLSVTAVTSSSLLRGRAKARNDRVKIELTLKRKKKISKGVRLKTIPVTLKAKM